MNKQQITCSVGDCNKPHFGRGYCRYHYMHFWRYGDPLVTPRRYQSHCDVDGCAAEHYAKGYCTKHYQRLKKHGDPLMLVGYEASEPFGDRFWRRVAITANPDKCWLWLGRLSAQGYGVVSLQSQNHGSHRVAFYLVYGHWPRPLGRHTCDNPPCCNPYHIIEGTPQDNVDDKIARGRHSFGGRSGSAKLDDEKVRDILCRIRNKEPLSSIARRYKVDASTIGNIKRGIIWRHVS